MSRQVVGVIPPGVTIDDALAAIKAFGRCYPRDAMFMKNDPSTGGMLFVYDPQAVPAAAGKARPQMETALGVCDPGDLFRAVFSAGGRDQQAGVAALAAWMIELLESAGAANFVEYGLTMPDVGRFAVTVQRCSGKTPAQVIDGLRRLVLPPAVAPAAVGVCPVCAGRDGFHDRALHSRAKAGG